MVITELGELICIYTMGDIEKKKNRKYNEAVLKSAISSVLDSKLSLYKASKEYNVPWSTLKINVERVKKEREEGRTEIKMLKVGRPFSLSTELEIKLTSYIIQMQELGFGLSVNQIRQIAFSLAEAAGCKHFFNKNRGCAGWNWWVAFKERYGLSLRTPENLSAGRAICSNPTMMADFYTKLQTTLADHDLMNCPERIWNCDETGLMYVNKPSKIVTKVGKKYVYNRTYAEKGTTTTVLACINAAGQFLPPMVIFKGVRNVPNLSKGALPNSLTRLSQKGWINADLFFEWLQFFDKNISPARPVLLIMDSHSSHLSPQVLEYAKSHQIILFTIPAHTSHILQPLDVGVFRPFKAAWRAELQTYKVNHPNSVPTRFDFHNFLTPVYEKCFIPSNIRGGFRKAGIYPLDKDAVCPEATAPSILSDIPAEQSTFEEVIFTQDYDVEIFKSDNDPLSEDTTKGSDTGERFAPSTSLVVKTRTPLETLQMEYDSEQIDLSRNTCNSNFTDESGKARPTSESHNKIEILEILALPKWEPKIQKQHKRSVPKAQCLTPVISTSSSPSIHLLRNTSRHTGNRRTLHKKISGPQKTQHASENKLPKSSLSDDDWICRSCNGQYSVDVKLKNGAKWITCSFCSNPYHIYCQSQIVDDDQTVYMCDICSNNAESSGEE